MWLDWACPVVDVADGVLADEPPLLVTPGFLDALVLVVVAGVGDESNAAARP